MAAERGTWMKKGSKIIDLWLEGFWWDEIAIITDKAPTTVKAMINHKGYSIEAIPKSRAWVSNFRKQWGEATGRFKSA